jgi:sterol desaturase/sphingolipid hydroxylase (fatty acid hydroxylase superfamily)
MKVSKLFSPSGFLIFPTALLLIYWVRIWMAGEEISTLVPGIITFSTLTAMILLEQVFRYEKGVSQRKLVLRDISSTLVNVLVTGTVMRAVFVPLVVFLPELLLGRSLFFSSSDSLGPFWVQLVLVVLLYSFLRYSVHRLQHRIGFLWNLHSYHHSVTDLKASNTFVSHPIDYSLRNVLPPVILGFVGFDPAAILFGAGILNTSSTLSHCGAGLHAGWLNKVFVTPEVHRWHHSAEVPEGHRFSVNYGVGFAVWDRIFGTYYLPEKNGVPVQPDRLGNPDGIADEGNYLKLFFLTRYLPRFSQAAEE